MANKRRARGRAALYLILPALALLAGCPLVSDLPLSDPAAARIDAALVGSWKARDSGTGEYRILAILPFNDHELVGLMPGDEAGSVDAYRILATKVGGEPFLSIRELGGQSSGWYIARYGIEGGKLDLTLVEDKLFEGRTFSRPEELSAFLGRNLANPLLFDPAEGPGGHDMSLERVPDQGLQPPNTASSNTLK